MKILSRVFVTLGILISTNSFAASGNSQDFRFGPLGALLGAVNVNYDIAINSDWTFGPELLYWNYTSNNGALLADIKLSAFSLGVRGNWYKNGVFTDGLYVGPSLNYTSVKASSSDIFGDVSATANGIYMGCLVGYGWFWDSFNMLLGGGLTMALGDSKVEIRDNTGTYSSVDIRNSGIALEYTLGWTF